MNFTYKALESAASAYQTLLSTVAQLKQNAQNKSRPELSSEKLDKVDSLRLRFSDAVNDDLGTPAALAVVWETVKSNIPPGDKHDLLLTFDEVLGLDIKRSVVSGQRSVNQVPEEIKQLIKDRETLRKKKKFKEADEIRKQIEDKGFKLEDTASGSQIKRTKSTWGVV